MSTSSAGHEHPRIPCEFEDITYEVHAPAGVLTINRPERLNALRGKTVEELIRAFRAAWADKRVRAVILTGAGDKAFCSGGDIKLKAASGNYGTGESGLWEIEHLQKVIRDIPKPVIAAVNGVAIGGGHVLHVICDLSIASESARFGQAGPRVGSFDAGFGTGFLARAIGEKRAREVWFLCRQYDTTKALEWGLVNAVVPADELMDEARRWVEDIALLSPTAIRFLKSSFNADSDHLGGIGSLAFAGLDAFYQTEESLEGVHAFTEKRAADFSRFA
ncbi:enoyl-CoA hydratase-related protein [Nocardia jejuensis]|uniref:enoyl-CoA hydratase-related protein n=1 Tax=Nocardia jejuensis TaxID=328049 RepID=UPI00082A5ECB|nr:enoyl-CoA hydratase-related protein [Nocardia jejuensis]